MLLNNELAKKKVVLMGLGLYDKGSGISAAKFFIGHCRELVITDLKPARELKKQILEINKEQRTRNKEQRTKNKRQGTKIIWHLGGHQKDDFKTADLIFQNPSVPADSPYLKIARQAGIPIVNDWSIFLSVHDPKIFIGVTGTRGKSTTTALIYEMLKKKYRKIFLAGNIGCSPLDFIDSYRGEPIVAELSSWLLHHFPMVQKSPNIAVVTNIMKDHLDKYQSMKEYVADKENIFRFQKAGDIAVMNWDNQYTRKMGASFVCHSERSEESLNKLQITNYKLQINSKIQNPKSKIIWFSLKKHWPRWMPFEKVKLLGEHNQQNALAAAAAAEAAGVSCRDILSVLRNFCGLPNRLELIRTIRGVKYYNDTTATTPDATIAALKTLGPLSVILNRAKRGEGSRTINEKDSSPSAQNDITKNIILICGGTDKKLDYQELAKYIRRYCKALVLLPGTATNKISLQLTAYSLQLRTVKSMNEAVKVAKKMAKKGDIVLLSPAAASFGLFRNEFDRGEEFRKIVAQLK